MFDIQRKIHQLLAALRSMGAGLESEIHNDASPFLVMLIPMLIGLITMLDGIAESLDDYRIRTEGKIDQLNEVLESVKSHRDTIEEDLIRTRNELQVAKDSSFARSAVHRTKILQEGLSPRAKFLACLPRTSGTSSKIHAIKAAREDSGCGLVEAKNAVESFLSSVEFSVYCEKVTDWLLTRFTPVVPKNLPDSQLEVLADTWARGMINPLVTRPNYLETPPGAVKTIDHLMDVLSQLRERSPLKGETRLVLCRAGAAMDNVDIEGAFLEYDDKDGSGQVELFGTWPGDLTENGNISLKVNNDAKQDFLLTFERPGHVEINVSKGKVMAHVYEGATHNSEQHPIFVYDGASGGNINIES